jgi:pimeloyl-ACP methyl ester carboxylesterase
MKQRSLILLSIAISLAGCAPFAAVKTQRPVYHPVTPAGQVIAQALTQDGDKPSAAISAYLDALHAASSTLQKTPDDAAARRDYNFALSRIIGTLQKANLDPWTHPLRVSAPDGAEYVLTHKRDPRPEWNPTLYDFTPADQFDVHGTAFLERTIRPGLGAPLVAVGRAQRKNYREDFTLSRVYYGVTAVARFDGPRRCVISFLDPLATERVTIGEHTFPLAADFTVPVGVMLSREKPEKKLGLSRLLRPAKYESTDRIARLQPYDPKKTVVLVVHGLMSEPSTWTPMINTLRGDAEIRKRYQFWFYSYPSGYPYPYSAENLRDQLDAIEKRYPLHKKMVLIGHSMGGCISRLLITDSGDKLWLSVFGRPPAQTPLSAATKESLEKALIFQHRKDIGRVIFISTPHRGANLAQNWLGRIASSLIRSPITLLQVGAEVLTHQTPDTAALRLKRIPNSVDTLAPNNRFVLALDKIPIAPGIPYYTISGDRGKGGNKDKTPPVMGDGVVPYWSSHLAGARSELVVPSHHGAHQNPQAIAEVRRILLESD